MNGLSRQEDGSHSMADAGSAQEYQDNEFRDELGVSNSTHPPVVLLSTICGAAKIGK
jgi:hypothetical protein